jgi:signal transduction histidine kinase
LYSIFQNVIDNAIKYKKIENKFESLIIITIDVNQEEVKIGITDNGIGISEEFEDKVFDMFFRGTTSSSGTGLGLYIVKTSVEKLEGTVTLNSIYGKGTSVNIVFPNRSS